MSNLKQIYDKYSTDFSDFAEKIYETIIAQGVINESENINEESVKSLTEKIREDIAEVKSVNSPFVNTLLRVYAETLSVEKAKDKHNQMLNAHKNAAFGFRKSHEINVDEASNTSEYNRNEDGFIDIKIKANNSQMRQIREFLNTIGVDYKFKN